MNVEPQLRAPVIVVSPFISQSPVYDTNLYPLSGSATIVTGAPVGRFIEQVSPVVPQTIPPATRMVPPEGFVIVKG
jgi:hypothetical protein